MRTEPCAGPLRAARALAVAGLVALVPAAQAFTVFACAPEWAALVRVLLPSARLHVATPPGQDPHHVEARPALIAQLRAADLAVCAGAGLEDGWLPVLQQRAANARAQDVFRAAEQVERLDRRPGAVATPWSGDVHAEGNPHVHADPRRLLQVTRALAARLARERPGEAASIAARAAAFEADWTRRIADWERRAAPLRGRPVATQHASFAYLWHWLGVEAAADLEPRPGLPPSPGHLQGLLSTLRARPPLALVIASHHDPRPARWLAAQLGGGVPLLVLPATVPADADAAGLARWFDELLERLLAAAAAGR